MIFRWLLVILGMSAFIGLLTYTGYLRHPHIAWVLGWVSCRFYDLLREWIGLKSLPSKPEGDQ